DGHRRTCDAEIEVASHREVVRELRILEMAHAGRSNTGDSELVVEPSGGPAAKVGSDRLVNRREHLQQHKHCSNQAQWRGQVATALDGSDQPAHGNGEKRWQQPAKNEDRPPSHCKLAARLGQYSGKYPLVPRSQTLD